jgi:hypothetical protein
MVGVLSFIGVNTRELVVLFVSARLWPFVDNL